MAILVSIIISRIICENLKKYHKNTNNNRNADEYLVSELVEYEKLTDILIEDIHYNTK